MTLRIVGVSGMILDRSCGLQRSSFSSEDYQCHVIKSQMSGFDRFEKVTDLELRSLLLSSLSITIHACLIPC